MDKVQCKLQNLLSLVLSSQARLQPFTTLSALLVAQQAAVLRNDTISELSCTSLKVQLKRSFVHGVFFATRSLFQAEENDQLAVSSKKVLQLNDGIYSTFSQKYFFQKISPKSNFSIQNFKNILYFHQLHLSRYG